MQLSYLGGTSFSQLGQFYVAPDSRIPPGACNSEKDLVILVQRGESRDTISLWRLQGTKRWEIDVIANHDAAGRVHSVTWSPDGNRFAVGYDTGAVTIHQIQDGLEIAHSLAKVQPSYRGSRAPRTPEICGLAWVRMPLSRFWSQDESTNPPPEMYPRGYDAPGSGHYLLKSLPKIDWKTPLYQNMSATSESPTQPHRAPKIQSFACLEGWPALPDDLTAASMESCPKPLPTMPAIPKDKSDGWGTDEGNTMVVVVDDSGSVESLVHGGFATGTMRTKIPMLQMSSIVEIESSIYFSTFGPPSPQLPTVRMFQLSGRLFTDKKYKIRDLMRLSTSIKTLHNYNLATLKECMEIWFGVPGREGANQMNYKWLRTLGQMQEHNGKAKDPLCDLLSLLLTGRPVTTALTELIENGTQTTERNYKRWWNTVRDAINSIRIAGERLKTSCDRLLALLVDLHGYAYIPDIKDQFRLESNQTTHCIKQITDLSEFCAAMANTARREVRGFQHFMSWLGHQMCNLPETAGPPKDFDVLLVSEYITEHLYPSQLDAFFDGELSTNPPSSEMRTITYPKDMKELLSQAKEALESVKKGKKVGIAFDSEQLLKATSRNAVVLAGNLGVNLREVFKQIEESISNEDDVESERGLRISEESGREVALPALMHEAFKRDLRLDLPEVSDVLLREMLTLGDPGENPSIKFVQYLAIRNPPHTDHYSLVTVIRITHLHDRFATPVVECALLECEAIDETENELYSQSAWFEVLDMRFYDNEHLAMVIQSNKVHEHRRHLVLVNFLKADFNPYPDRLAQLEPGSSAMSFANVFQLPVFIPAFPVSPIYVRHSRLLQENRPGTGVTLAVNSKRKVAVILDHTRGSLHCYDLNEEEEDEEEEMEE